MLVQACSLNLNISVQSRTIEPAKVVARHFEDQALSGLKPWYDVYPLTPALRLGLVTVLSFD